MALKKKRDSIEKHKNEHFKTMKDEKYIIPNVPWDVTKWIKGNSCNRWFKNIVRLEMHAPYCQLEPIG